MTRPKEVHPTAQWPYLAWLPMIACAIVLAVAALSIWVYDRYWHTEQKTALQHLAIERQAALQNQFSSMLSATFTLSSVIRHLGGIYEDFPLIAAEVIQQTGTIAHAQLAPDGIVSRVYPNPKFQYTLSYDYLNNRQSAADAALAIHQHVPVLSVVRFPPSQKNTIVTLYPVFSDIANHEKFWGFTALIFYLDDLLQNTGFAALDNQGIYYRISAIDHNPHQTRIIATNILQEFNTGQIRKLSFANSEWILSFAFKDPPLHPPGYYTYWLIALLSSLSIAYALHLLLKQPLRLSHLVCEKNKELEHHAYHDTLTGLVNRKCFMDRLNQTIKLIQRQQIDIAVLDLDLDQFSRINDTMGHAAGDKLLKTVSARFSSCIRDQDTVAHFGGDEFGFILVDIGGAKGAAKVAAKIKKALAEPIQLNHQNILLTSSMGIVLAPIDSNNADELLKYAGLALYKAKDQGRNRYQFFNPTMRMIASKRMWMEQQLYKALDEGAFMLYFQPQISLHTKKVVGLEVLVRWRYSPDHILTPGQFIGLAEETGAIIPLGQWVLRQTCQLMQSLEQIGYAQLRFAINLSPKQFEDPQLLDKIDNILSGSGIHVSSIEFEITESTLIKNITTATTILTRLRERGISIALDDFGTGYSSLNLLRHLPVDTLKIDQKFICDIITNKANQAIVTAMITLGHELGLTVVAEGIESASQLKHLHQCGCDIGQGYLFSQPIPADIVRDMCTSDPIQYTDVSTS